LAKREWEIGGSKLGYLNGLWVTCCGLWGMMLNLYTGKREWEIGWSKLGNLNGLWVTCCGLWFMMLNLYTSQKRI
jgi:hypothetical protein